MARPANSSRGGRLITASAGDRLDHEPLLATRPKAEPQAAHELYEAHDLDTEESQMYFYALFHATRGDACASADARRLAWIVHRHRQFVRTTRMWLVFILVGIATGVVAFALAQAVELLTDAKFKLHDKIIGSFVGSPLSGVFFAGYAAHLMMTLLYAGIAAVLTAAVAPVASGSGIPECKAYLNGCAIPHVLDIKTGVVKMVGLMFSVAAGLAIGKEGPLVHTGSVLAKALGGLKFRSFKHLRQTAEFVSGGCAAGVAAAFGAPLGGVLFSLEEASTRWSLEGLWYTFGCAMASALTLTLCFAIRNGHFLDINNVGSSGLISFGMSSQDVVFSIWELPIFALMGVFCGGLGALFNAANVRLAIWRRSHVSGSRRRVLEVLVIAALTASVGYWAPAFFTSHCQPIPASAGGSSHRHHRGDAPHFASWDDAAIGGDTPPPSPSKKNPRAHVNPSYFKRYTCPKGEFNDVATLMFSPMETSLKVLLHAEVHLSNAALLLVTVSIYIEAVLTFGIGVPAGLFVPLIFLGAAGGRFLGEFMRDKFGGGSTSLNPGSYSLIGAASMLGGVTRMTISLSVIIAETTGNITWVLPIMIVLLASKWTGDIVNESIYDMHVELKGIPFLGPHAPSHFAFIDAGSVMKSRVHGIDVVHMHDETVGRVVALLRESPHNGFPVVSVVGGQQLIEGHITRDSLARYLHALLAVMDARQGDSDGKTVMGHRLKRRMMLRRQTLTRNQYFDVGSQRNYDVGPLLLEPPRHNDEGGAVEVAAAETAAPSRPAEEQEGDHLVTLDNSSLTALVDGVAEAQHILREMEESVFDGREASLGRLPASREIPIEQIFHPCPVVARESWPMTRVYSLFRLFGIRQMAVSDVHNRLVGIITRHEIKEAMVHGVVFAGEGLEASSSGTLHASVRLRTAAGGAPTFESWG